MADLEGLTGTFQYEILGKSDVPAEAESLRELVKRVPGFAPAWKDQAILADTDAEKLAAIEKGLGANPDAETKGFFLINKALIMDRSGDQPQQVQPHVV